jgi:hypothetical protein
MARLSAGGATAPDATAINLTRLLARLQKTLEQPDMATEQRLRTSSYERSKVEAVRISKEYGPRSQLIKTTFAESRLRTNSIVTARARHCYHQDPVEEARGADRVGAKAQCHPATK